jgi:hypothetical protein
MLDTNERPVCHRAEDLVTYLYGEAGEADAMDFREHLKACEACLNEFVVFSNVHDSIVVWRNEALGSFNPMPVTNGAAADTRQFVRRERKLSALEAIREFFGVSPLWLRGATAFAALLLCALAILTISRMSRQPVPIATNNPELKYSQKDLDSAVQKGIDAKLAEIKNQQTPNTSKQVVTSPGVQPPVESTAYRTQPRKTRTKGLTLQEREQLAADLQLLPAADDEELPFGVLSEEPNQ